MRLFHTKDKADIYGEEIPLEYVSLEECEQLDLFNCGNETIDEIIKHELVSDTMTKSFAVLNRNDNDAVAVYSLSCSGFVIRYDQKIFIYPAVEIKYFAVNEKYQDIQYCDDKEQGCLSNAIFDRIIADIYSFTENYCGADKIILYAVPSAYDFYKRIGFEDFKDFMQQSQDRFLDGCIPMFFNM